MTSKREAFKEEIDYLMDTATTSRKFEREAKPTIDTCKRQLFESIADNNISEEDIQLISDAIDMIALFGYETAMKSE
jgi:hypothetical protein